MPSTITLDKSDPAVSEAIAGCVVGTEETLTITFTPETVDETTVTGTIGSAAYAEPEMEEEVVEEVVEDVEPAAPAAPKKPGKNPAVAILIGMKNKPAKA